MKELVTGLMVIVTLSLAIGKYDKLRAFARKEAAKSLRGWPDHPFFPKNYEFRR